MIKTLCWLFAICLLFISSGCKQSQSTPPDIDYIGIGQQLTDDPTIGAPGNAYTCITCHKPPELERVIANTAYPADSLANLGYRVAYWGDTLSLRSAINKCIVTYMRGTTLTSVSDRWIALEAYLQSISPLRSASARTIRLDSIGFNTPGMLLDTNAFGQFYRGGNDTLGANAYNRYCLNCHGFGRNNATELRGQPS